MADYASPTVVQPTIPIIDMTPLERLLLTHIFEAAPDGDGLYLFAYDGPSDMFDLPIDELRTALAESVGIASAANSYIAERMGEIGDDDTHVEIDFSGMSFEFLLQDIVKRSTTLKYVTIVSAFTCSRMRPDGFGGMAVVITADMIRGKSTGDIINDFLDEAEHGPLLAAPGFGTHVLLRIAEADVRAQIAQIIETDDALTKLTADAITDADIRAGCRLIVERMDLSYARDSAIFRAALVAIGEAERRLASPP